MQQYHHDDRLQIWVLRLVLRLMLKFVALQYNFQQQSLNQNDLSCIE